MEAFLAGRVVNGETACRLCGTGAERAGPSFLVVLFSRQYGRSRSSVSRLRTSGTASVV